MANIVSWVHEYESLLGWLAGMSLLMFVVSLVAFPLVIVFLPQDYFVRHRRDPARQTRRHPAVWLTLSTLKNVFGAVLVLAGIAMLVLPGQGRRDADQLPRQVRPRAADHQPARGVEGRQPDPQNRGPSATRDPGGREQLSFPPPDHDRLRGPGPGVMRLRVCSRTRPGPVRRVMKRPSPPKAMRRQPATPWMS